MHRSATCGKLRGMDLAASLAMTALTTQHDEAGVVGGCRQLAQITIGKRRQPEREFALRNNTTRQTPKFFPPQNTVSGGKDFFGSKKSFPLLWPNPMERILAPIEFPNNL